MKSSKNLRAFLLSIVLSSFAFPAFLTPVVSAQKQDATVAIQRGYRTGYSDGYMSGYRDTIDSIARNFARHDEYNKADRAFNKEYGSVEDYRDGYQQGFESGYATGYDRRSFEAALPTGLKRRGVIVGDRQNLATNTGTDPQPTVITNEPSDTAASVTTTATAYQATNNSIFVIPRETELILELQEDLDTEHSREGEKFTARVVSPSELAGATVEGRVAKILKPGYLKKRAELLLSFDRLVLSDNRWSNFSASLTEVLAVKGDNISRVDSEGTAVGISSLKTNAIKVGATTGGGAIVGALVGGPVGAAVGAGMGAAFGVGAVVIKRGKYIRLNRNQQLRIKTAYETQIR